MSENTQAESTPVAKPKYTKAELTGLTWYGAPGDAEGPQVAFPEDGTGNVVMRHGADHDAPLLVYTPGEWEAFQAGAADGEFDEVEQQIPTTGPAAG